MAFLKLNFAFLKFNFAFLKFNLAILKFNLALITELAKLILFTHVLYVRQFWQLSKAIKTPGILTQEEALLVVSQLT